MTMDSKRDDAVAPATRVLWLSGLAPHGVTSGLAMYTGGLVTSLADAGASVSGLALGETGLTDEVWQLVPDEPRSRLRSVFSRLPYISARLATSEHHRAVGLALDAGVDVVVIDHLMSGWCLDQVIGWREASGGLIVHVSHNHEALVRGQWARSVPLASVQGLYLRFDAARIARLERRLLRAADLVTTITTTDRRTMADDVEFGRSMVLSPGWSPAPAVAPPAAPCADDFAGRPRRVVILGSFDWQAKRDNLRAVVAALDEPLAAAGIELVVIGGGDDEFLAAQHGVWRATSFLGRVDDADAELARCRMGIVAEPVGGGFKLKALDYGMSGLPMAVLSGSMEGLDLEGDRDVVVADSLEELGRLIIDTVDDTDRLTRLATSTQKMLEGRFRWADRGRQLAVRLADMNHVRTRPARPGPGLEGTT